MPMHSSGATNGVSQVPTPYLKENVVLVQQQLVFAAVRPANILNSAFGHNPNPVTIKHTYYTNTFDTAQCSENQGYYVQTAEHTRQRIYSFAISSSRASFTVGMCVQTRGSMMLPPKSSSFVDAVRCRVCRVDLRSVGWNSASVQMHITFTKPRRVLSPITCRRAALLRGVLNATSALAAETWL